MTLFEVFNVINKVAVQQPNINTIVNTGNIFDLNTENWQIKYGAFCVQQEEHIQDGDFITYSFNLFFVDRLTDDRRNKLMIQSNAITTLMNIVNGLRDIEILDTDANITYQVFTERFAAECAGAYCRINITSDIPYCYDEFINRVNMIIGDFNYDFSNDYFIKTFGSGEFSKDDYNDSYNKQYNVEPRGEFSNSFAISENKPDDYNNDYDNGFLNDNHHTDSQFD